MVPRLFFIRNCVWETPYHNKTDVNKFASVKVAGIVPWIYYTRVKRTYHKDPKNVEWTAQRDPADPRETKTILKKKEKKILDEPLQDEAT